MRKSTFYCIVNSIHRMCRSEEDNDPLTDDGNSIGPAPIPIPRHSNGVQRSKPSGVSRTRHHLLSEDDGVDSPTYDGDIESSTTAGAETPARPPLHHHHHHTHLASSVATPITVSTSPGVTPVAEPSNPLSPSMRATNPNSHLPVFISPPVNTIAAPLIVTEEPAVPLASKEAFNPAALTPDDIQSFVAKAIEGEPHRKYKINPPPIGRPVRVYADGTVVSSIFCYVTNNHMLGVYDLFHFGYCSLHSSFFPVLTSSPIDMHSNCDRPSCHFPLPTSLPG